ncbi:MAG: type VI secretion system tube protein Hcp [Gammaproteobacteria bacterium]|nr:type VI secretion system tube protein Hcp [Gammaproteobacteria bacterium]
MNRLTLLSFLGLSCLAATTTLARADEIYLRITGLPGDAVLASSSTYPAAQGWVRAEAVSSAHGLLQPGATTVTFERLTVTRTHDPSSTFFLSAALRGNAIQSATIDIRAPSASLPLTRLSLSNVFVRKVATSYSTSRLPLDVIELEFSSIEWLYQASSSTVPVRTQWTVGKI